MQQWNICVDGSCAQSISFHVICNKNVGVPHHMPKNTIKLMRPCLCEARMIGKLSLLHVYPLTASTMPILLAPALFIIVGISGKMVFKSFLQRNSLYFNSWVTSAFWTKAEFISHGRYLEIKPVKIENNVKYKSNSNCILQLHFKLYCRILVITYTAPLVVIIGCRMDLLVR